MDVSRLFQEKGYVIFTGAFSSSLIDPILQALEEIKKKKNKPFYYSQATHRYKKLNTDKYGFVDESMLGFTRNKFLGQIINFIFRFTSF